MPVGMWVILTAESVVFTDCPPGPEDRKKSMRMSDSLRSTSTWEKTKGNSSGQAGLASAKGKVDQGNS